MVVKGSWACGLVERGGRPVGLVIRALLSPWRAQATPFRWCQCACGHGGSKTRQPQS